MKSVKEICKTLMDFNKSTEELNKYIDELTEEEAKSVLRNVVSAWYRRADSK